MQDWARVCLRIHRGRAEADFYRYKYDPLILQCALFPHLHGTSILGPPNKRRKLSAQGNTDEKLSDANCAVVLECAKEIYLVTCADGDNGSRRYTLSTLNASDPPGSVPAVSSTSSKSTSLIDPEKPPLPNLNNGEDSTSSSPPISLRTLCSDLVETNFLFEKNAVIVKRSVRSREENDGGPDSEDEMKISVLRWRWSMDSR